MEMTRAMWGWGWLETVWQDLRYGLRMMGRRPGFTAVAVMSLGLGIGANTAIFSLIHTLMLRMLPVSEPERLVELLQKYPGEPRGNGYWTWAAFEHYRDSNRVFAGLAGTSPPRRLAVRGEGLGPEAVQGETVTGNFFSVMGLRPALGRLVGLGDSGAAVISWGLWKRRFHMDPGVLGRRLVVENVPMTVVGVMAQAYTGLLTGSKTDLWLSAPEGRRPGLILIGRLAPGVSIERARAEMAVLYQWTIEERAKGSKDPLVRQLKVEVEPAGAGLSLLRDRFGKPLLALMAMVGLLLLLACTNIASLLLARGAERQREMAVRVSLGAGGLRLVRQVITESVLLAAAGCAVGLFVAYFGAQALVRVMLSGRPMPGLPEALAIPVEPHGAVLLFTMAVGVAAGLLFGTAPAWNTFRAAPSGHLRTRTSGATFGKSLVAVQVALSVVLLSSAALFGEYLAGLRSLDLGFERDHVLLVRLDASGSGYTTAQLGGVYRELLGQMERIPGVRSASVVGASPISGAGASRFATVEGFRERPEDRRYLTLNWVGPRYFETMGTPLLAGRDFRFGEAGRVAIVSRSMARHYFGSATAVGKHLTLDGETEPYEIVGVVGDAKYYEIREAPVRTVYFDAFQTRQTPSQFVLRTAVEPGSVTSDVRRAVQEATKTITVAKVTTLADQVDASIVLERMVAMLAGAFGGLGAVLAAVGLYGLLAYTVARRVHEIGIRMALGASAGHVVGMVVRDALVLVGVGLAAGVPAALWGREAAVYLMADIPVKNVGPIVFGSVGMVVVGLGAAYWPARRAARVDPMVALRHE